MSDIIKNSRAGIIGDTAIVFLELEGCRPVKLNLKMVYEKGFGLSKVVGVEFSNQEFKTSKNPDVFV